MTKRKKIKLDQTPAYPTNDDARIYAAARKDEIEDGKDPKTTFLQVVYSQSIDVKATWGYKDYFFVFAHPPAGFIIKEPDDVLKLQTFEGWIFQYVPQADTFNLLVKASRDGTALFWQQHNQIKLM